MHRKKAFTLIELLVVIAIIALLLSILMPALNKIKEQTRRLVCRTNLHQWGLAVNGYAAANDDKNLSAFGYTDQSGNGLHANVVPNEFWFEIANTTGADNYNHPGQFSYEAMAPYMPSGFNPKGLTRAQAGALSPTDPAAKGLLLTGAWTCPSLRAPELDLITDNLWRIQQRGFMRLRYSYYGRSDLWINPNADVYVTNPEDFGGKYPGSRHLLMTDALYRWVGEGLDYNHSFGKRKQEEIMVAGVEPAVAGINKMYGDGSAIWKDRREFQGPDADSTLLDMSSNPPSGNKRVSSIGNQAINWY